jgi:multiple sugar transport system ATP-binding protein
VTIGGRRADLLPPSRRDVALVFQSYALYPHLTVAENISVPLRMRRLSFWQRLPLVGGLVSNGRAKTAEIEREVREVARSLGLSDVLQRKPGQLSGGQRQRLAVGRALVRRPVAFLMDEPLSNLDAKLRVQMRVELKELHSRLHTTFVYVTHDQVEAMTMSDRVAVMMDGELLQVAPPNQLYGDPDDLRVAGFIGSPRINRLRGTVGSDCSVSLPGLEQPIAAGLTQAVGAAVTICLRPEWMERRMKPGSDTLEGRIRLIEHHGADVFVHSTMMGHDETLISRLTPNEMTGLSVGSTIYIGARWMSALVFDDKGQRIRRPIDHSTPHSGVRALAR